ncbi:MAG: tyrosine-type recombinase/integrase, partial [Desulfobacterales bacterium]|nr:tyrosine-type recombinase/integrase [Desulfobacterales bacterium]
AAAPGAGGFCHLQAGGYMKLTECLRQFFDQYLTGLKGASKHTVKAYRDTFTLFLPFAAQYHSCKISSLEMEHLANNLIMDFLDHLETERHNKAVTRNLRLATFQSLAKMIRILYPEQRNIAERLLNIPRKRAQKKLIGFLSQEEIMKVIDAVNLKKKDGLRDYTILHLLFDSGARASEIATLDLEYFDPQKRTLAILGKGNRYRLIGLWPKTAQLLQKYIANYRINPKPGSLACSSTSAARNLPGMGFMGCAKNIYCWPCRQTESRPFIPPTVSGIPAP